MFSKSTVSAGSIPVSTMNVAARDPGRSTNLVRRSNVSRWLAPRPRWSSSAPFVASSYQGSHVTRPVTAWPMEFPCTTENPGLSAYVPIAQVKCWSSVASNTMAPMRRMNGCAAVARDRPMNSVYFGTVQLFQAERLFHVADADVAQ